MSYALVIVESPAKAKKIGSYLGKGYTVESSIGHIRDLPSNSSEVPAAYRDEPWARLGVDVDNDFKPLYVISSDKGGHIRHLKKLAREADELLLATDGDREGEAIAWHLIEVLNPRVPVKRMVFREITPEAIRAAVESPRELDRRLVDAQEARRILDRLYGFEVSPVLWKKIKPKLSAGRVQSVATRIVVERERERIAFVEAGYWRISGVFAALEGDTREFAADLHSLDGARVAGGRDFDDSGAVRRAGLLVLDEDAAAGLIDDLGGAAYAVRSRESKPYRRRPAAPFVTSTFQQEAGRKLSMSSSMAMRAAQGLYEKGFITYMRTDSTTLSDTALAAARKLIAQRYGKQFLPDSPRRYKGKAPNAQEAHEAIRPAGDSFADPATVAAQVSSSEARAYELIYKRTLASQMTDCTGETVQLRLAGSGATGREAVFAASGTVISHKGFREVYSESSDPDRHAGDSASGADTDAERRLPPLAQGDAARCESLEASGHVTSPPSRYTEASLVKRLEELGVGRPSTYASIIKTIIDRGYVWKKGSALVPAFTAFSVVNLLERHFPNLIDYAFTARMEDDLDKIAGGDEEMTPWLSRFYFGVDGGEPGLKEKVSTRLDDIDARKVNTIELGATDGGEPVAVRVGRHGPYVQVGSPDDDGGGAPRTASIADDTEPAELTVAAALAAVDAPSGERTLGTDPDSGMEVFARDGRYGPYVQLGTREEQPGRPKTASLFATMTLERISLAEALEILSLPRVVGADPADGEPITVQNGRYGPYLAKGKETRSLDNEEQLLSVTLEECLRRLAQPKQRGRGAANPPLRELGADPETGKEMVVKDGRFGPYVTDGEVNASLRKGDAVEELSVERASELLAERRARGPAKKAAKKTAKRPAKKAAKGSAKKTAKRPAKKAAKKTASRTGTGLAEMPARKAAKRPAKPRSGEPGRPQR